MNLLSVLGGILVSIFTMSVFLQCAIRRLIPVNTCVETGLLRYYPSNFYPVNSPTKVGELAEIIRLMAESAPVETVHLNYPSNCTHGCTYTIGEEDLSLRLLLEWVVISRLLRFV